MSHGNHHSHHHGHTDVPTLVRMANQIAAAFAHKDEATAVQAVREHIEAFWTRGMRMRLAVATGEAVAGLDPRASRAIRNLDAAADGRRLGETLTA